MNFILIMHTPLAQAMSDVLKHVFPEISEQLHQNKSLKIIDICPHSCLEEQKQKIGTFLNNHVDDLTICLNDLFGATPHRLMNESIEQFKQENPEKVNKIHSLTGVNIPIFLRAVKKSDGFENFSWHDFVEEITKNNACIM